MEDGAACVLPLQLFLLHQRLERVIRVANGQLGGVGVVGLVVCPRLDDVGVLLAVFLREAVGGALSWRGLKVVHVSRGLLQFHHALANVVEDADRERVPRRGRDVVEVVREVADRLIHPVDTEC